MKTNLLFIYTESPLHAGTGTGLASVDLPIQRERTTQYPNVQGSGIKGALRSLFEYYVYEDDSADSPDKRKKFYQDKEIEALFGLTTDNPHKVESYGGALSFGEARIVLFPVRSLMGVFAYITCPHILARVFRESGAAELDPKPFKDMSDEKCFVVTSSNVVVKQKVVLEEFSFEVQEDKQTQTTDIAKWFAAKALPTGDEYQYWRDLVKTNFVILSDNSFRDFVVNSTEVVTRVRILPDSKTVKYGALWTQEALPADTLLMSTMFARSSRDSRTAGNADLVLQFLYQKIKSGTRLQLGGDETTGSGQVVLRWLNEGTRNE